MKLYNILISSACALALASCSDDFLENVPQGKLNEGVMNSVEGVDLAVTGAYATFHLRYADSDAPHEFAITNWAYGEVRADNAYKGGGGINDINDFHEMEIMTVRPTTGNCDGKWFNVYCGISRCNSAIRLLKNCSEEEVPNKNIRLAEMYVIRSFWYFDLVRLFNKIPYMEEDLPEKDYVDVPNDQFTREQLLGKLANTLMDAAAALPERQAEVGRINRNIAYALAAKVKLYQAYEQDPQTHAVVNINKTLLNEVVTIIDKIQGYDLLSDFQQLDLIAYENGVESVFAIQYSMNDGSKDGGRINWCNLLNSPSNSPYNGDGFFLPSQDLINAYQTDANGLPVFDYQSKPNYSVVKFDENDPSKYYLDNVTPNVDPRLDFVVGRPTITYKTYPNSPCGLWVRNQGDYGYNCAKRFWVSPESSDMYQGWPWGASALNWQLIRYADLLLYKAEALIELGTDLDQARVIINRIRERAKNSKYVKDFANPDQDAANYCIGLYPSAGWNQDYARKALRTEMRLEKALEGERFFDLVRWGIARETMNNYFRAEEDNRPYYSGVDFPQGREYLPIHVNQYQFSLGRYTQNPGYPSF